MMMVDKERVTKAIFKAVDEANGQLSEHEQLEKNPETVLLEANAGLDSLGSVIFLSVVEDKIEEEFGTAINLMDERAVSQQDSPFATIGKLIDYISLLLEKKVADSCEKNR